MFKNYKYEILNMAIEHAVRVQCHKVMRKKGPKRYSIKIKKRLKNHRRPHAKSKNHRRSHNIKKLQGHTTLQGRESSQGSKGSQGH